MKKIAIQLLILFLFNKNINMRNQLVLSSCYKALCPPWFYTRVVMRVPTIVLCSRGSESGLGLVTGVLDLVTALVGASLTSVSSVSASGLATRRSGSSLGLVSSEDPEASRSRSTTSSSTRFARTVKSNSASEGSRPAVAVAVS